MKLQFITLFILLSDTITVNFSGKTTTHFYIIGFGAVVLLVLLILFFSNRNKNKKL